MACDEYIFLFMYCDAPSSAVLPTLISNVGKSSNVSASDVLWRVAEIVVRLSTYHCRRRQWVILIYCLIFSILVGPILLFPFRWGNVRMRLNRMLPLVFCCFVVKWLWRVLSWILCTYSHVWSCWCACGLLYCKPSLLELFGGFMFCSWSCAHHLLILWRRWGLFCHYPQPWLIFCLFVCSFFSAPYKFPAFDVAFCASGLVSLTWIGR